MTKPPLKVADPEVTEPMVEIIFPADSTAITADFYPVTLAQPVKIRVPASAIASIDE